MSANRPRRRTFWQSVTGGFNAGRHLNRITEDCANGSILTGRRRSNSYTRHRTPASESQIAEQRQANEERRHQETMALLNAAIKRQR